MNYRAIIRIDEDRWCKHPYGIVIYDDNDNEVESSNWLDSRDDCYRLSDKYGINPSDIEEVFY